jgi:hypothetical protein
MASGLPSVSPDRDGVEAEGPTSIAVNPDGSVVVVNSAGQNGSLAKWPTSMRRIAGTLMRVSPGVPTVISNVAKQFKAAQGPAAKGSLALVADPFIPAAVIPTQTGYTVLSEYWPVLDLNATGTVIGTHTIGEDSDYDLEFDGPSGLAQAPNGDLFAGILADPPNRAILRFAGGDSQAHLAFKTVGMVRALTLGPDGSLYVAEDRSSNLLSEDADCDVLQIAPDGTRTIIARGLYAPGGIVADASGVYVSDLSMDVAKPDNGSPQDIADEIASLPRRERPAARVWYAVHATGGRILHITP